MVNAPATPSGSPVSTYASISWSLNDPKVDARRRDLERVAPRGDVGQVVAGVQDRGAAAQLSEPVGGDGR